MNTPNQDEIWQDLDELYMDLGEWISFFEDLLENGNTKSLSQVVFGNLTIKQLISRIKKDMIEYEKLLKMINKEKSNGRFLKIISSMNESIENLEREIRHESI